MSIKDGRFLARIIIKGGRAIEVAVVGIIQSSLGLIRGLRGISRRGGLDTGTLTGESVRSTPGFTVSPGMEILIRCLAYRKHVPEAPECGCDAGSEKGLQANEPFPCTWKVWQAAALGILTPIQAP